MAERKSRGVKSGCNSSESGSEKGRRGGTGEEQLFSSKRRKNRTECYDDVEEYDLDDAHDDDDDDLRPSLSLSLVVVLLLFDQFTVLCCYSIIPCITAQIVGKSSIGC